MTDPSIALYSGLDDLKPFIPDKAPLICLVLYLYLEFDDEEHRVKQINIMFGNYDDAEYMQTITDILRSDKEAYACYQAVKQPVQEGLIEKVDEDLDFATFETVENKAPKFYTVSFLEWAEQAGYTIPEYVMPDNKQNIEHYHQGKIYREETRNNFLKIDGAEFEQRMGEPLWVMTDALLHIIGYKTRVHEEDKVRFLRFKSTMQKIRQYALDAQKTKELELFDYHVEPITNPNTDDFEKQRDAPFFACKVKPKEFVEWVSALPIELPIIEGLKGNKGDASLSKKEIIQNLLEQENDFELCSGSDPVEKQGAVAFAYNCLLIEIKTALQSVLPVSLYDKLKDIDDFKCDFIFLACEAKAKFKGLLPDIRIALENENNAMNENEPSPVQKNVTAPYQVKFLDVTGEVVLNDMFVLACPTANGQNYRIIRYLVKNPNRFVMVDELVEKALDGKDLDKRLTDFVAQINMNKNMGELFFDTSKDSIRLNNPVTSERMTEKNINKLRIKPA